MESKNLIIVFSVVLVASFVGALLGAYLVEKTQTPASPQGLQQAPYGMPSQSGQMMPNGEQGPSQGGQPNSPGGQMPNGAPQGTQPPQGTMPQPLQQAR